ncbi:polar amino acid transport system ATP-binding protein [Nonomuraea thailandensis]|uniref:Polar amino acid transport system ATP-binding protein n=1 Tax=Nonomuraea thailandensis TaxID=1188745 RepID=A0A9X2K377_9ACTN|nr:amino acid ABC transporter ATP-binding protein [Nonomuraea thailandensis]MCP2358089.1 polar amino acid transport system ATP-binding protein [Nonomuraea thailandensis]
MSPLIELRGVTKSYGDHTVLRGIDLEVAAHEVISLIGASGCGKSTLLRCVNGLETIDGGEIAVDGDVVSGPGVDLVRLRRQVGMVFQSYNLFPHMTVLQNAVLAPVKTGLCSKEEAEERAMAMLGRVGLADRAGSYPDQMSGGQQQRAAIARTMLMSPRILLLDEITSALDPELVIEVLNIVQDLAESGMTMLLTTHEMGFAREISGRVCFLHGGGILEQGPPAQIFDDPAEQRTRDFLRKVSLAGRL